MCTAIWRRNTNHNWILNAHGKRLSSVAFSTGCDWEWQVLQLWTKWNPKAAMKKSFRERLTKVNVILGCFVHFSRCRRYHNMVWDILLVAMSNICDRQFAQSTRISRDHLYHKRRRASPSLSFACICIKAIFGIQQTLHSNDGNNNSRSLSFSMGMHFFFCVCNR